MTLEATQIRWQSLTFNSNEFSLSWKSKGDGSFENDGNGIILLAWLVLLLARAASFFGFVALSSSSLALCSDAEVPSPGAIPSAKRTPRRFFVDSL